MPRPCTESFIKIMTLHCCASFAVSHLIRTVTDEESEAQQVAVCQCRHSRCMKVLGSNLRLSDVRVQLLTITLS